MFYKHFCQLFPLTWRLNTWPAPCWLMRKEKVEKVRRQRMVSTRELKYIVLLEKVSRMRASVSEENRRHRPITMAAMYAMLEVC